MVVRRTCRAQKADGERCQKAPQLDSAYCWMHDPANAEAVADARRLGGLRRRREGTVAGAYDFQGLGTVADIRRLLEVAVVDTLGLDNSIARARTLGYLALTAVKLLESGELEDRVQVLEQAVLHRQELETTAFDDADDPFPLVEDDP